MIALWGLPLGLVIGWFRGGTFEQLGSLRPRGVATVFAALVLQVLIIPPGWLPQFLVLQSTAAWHLVSYALVIAFLVVNRRIRSLWGIAAGVAMNAVTIAANGGFMPTSVETLRRSGQTAVADRLTALPNQPYNNVVAMGPNTRLNFLGDWLFVPTWIPFGGNFSPGDLVLLVSVAWLIQAGMQHRVTDGT